MTPRNARCNDEDKCLLIKYFIFPFANYSYSYNYLSELSALILVPPLRNFNTVIEFAFFSGYSGKATGLLHGQNCVVLIYVVPLINHLYFTRIEINDTLTSESSRPQKFTVIASNLSFPTMTKHAAISRLCFRLVTNSTCPSKRS